MSAAIPDFLQAKIVTDLTSLLARGACDPGHTKELTDLLQATNSRAVGCWRHVDGHLELAGFLAVDDMPVEVQQEFRHATRSVALDQTQFGIVQAVRAGGPAINHRMEKSPGPAIGSIGWLGRFAAGSSLAIPLFRQAELLGTLAVATRDRIEPGDTVWELIQAVASRVGAAKNSPN